MNTIKEWSKVLIPYEQAVQELKVKFKQYRDQKRTIGEYSPIEFCTGRVKKISSIVEKTERLQIPIEQIEEKMEDIAGIRIMCQFVDDIYTVVDFIRGRSGKDFQILYEKDYVTNPKESGYRSFHIIIRYPVHTALGTKEIIAELQIRTLAMNFWAVIEHSLNYKYKQDIPLELQNRLKAAATAATALDIEMSEISKEVINAQLLFEEKSNLIREITLYIKLLYAAKKEREAMEFQRRFDSVVDKEGIAEYDALLTEIRECFSKI